MHFRLYSSSVFSKKKQSGFCHILGVVVGGVVVVVGVVQKLKRLAITQKPFKIFLMKLGAHVARDNVHIWYKWHISGFNKMFELSPFFDVKKTDER